MALNRLRHTVDRVPWHGERGAVGGCTDRGTRPDARRGRQVELLHELARQTSLHLLSSTRPCLVTPPPSPGSPLHSLSPKLLVLPDEAVWPQRPEFLAALRAQLASMPQPPPYYPGAHQRYAAFQNEYPEAETIEAPSSQPEGLESAVYESLGQDISPLHTLLVDAGVLGDKAANTYAIQTEASRRKVGTRARIHRAREVLPHVFLRPSRRC